MLGGSALTALLLSAGACVNDAATAVGDAGSRDAQVANSKPLLPWKVGNSWTYRVTGGGVVSMKVTEIGAEEIVGGNGPHKTEMAFKVTTAKMDGTDKSISWQQAVDGKVLRYREQSFSKATGELTLEEHWDPFKLHIDGTAKHTVAAVTWLEQYEETKLPAGSAATTASQSDRWTVQSADEAVTVPAGTFKHAIVITKAGGSNLKTYWYVRGIGKIKETGGQTEELVSYQIAP
jgi:hypothetical protein